MSATTQPPQSATTYFVRVFHPDAVADKKGAKTPDVGVAEGFNETGAVTGSICKKISQM
jgi:hypothetical protein